ncbi:hypothetical protein A3860_17760 [Niastella vici]|uniref:FecR protein domain-containing protein n=1 Tax=Niastella vici TaxID=1703345 RepID=A0A1V9G4D9_9BACT|nr:hypothetical protein [Niastella vici]OQP65511.1 hypothetical protein A3860_17760 [Niastella vici]
MKRMLTYMMPSFRYTTDIFKKHKIFVFLCYLSIGCNSPQSRSTTNSLSELEPVANDTGLTIIEDIQLVAGKKVRGQLIHKNNSEPFQLNRILEKDSDGFYYRETPTGSQYSFTSKGTIILMNNCTIFGVDSSKRVFSFKEGEVLITVNENFNRVKLDGGITIQPTKGTRINITAYRSAYDSTLRITAIDNSLNIFFNSKDSIHVPIGYELFHTPSKDSLIKVDTSDVLIWTKRSFNYNKISNVALLERARRWYNYHLVYDAHLVGENIESYRGGFAESRYTILTRINEMSKTVKWESIGKTICIPWPEKTKL